MDTYSLLYPILIAPVMEAFDLPAAIRIAHGLNALLFASAAIPAYLLTRWVLASRAAALAVAALTVFVPWLSFTLSLLTEVVAYPAIIWAVYGIALTVAAPSARGDALALLAIGIAYAARTQFVFLFAVLPGAIVLHSLGYEIFEAGRGEKLDRREEGRPGGAARPPRRVGRGRRSACSSCSLARTSTEATTRSSVGRTCGRRAWGRP